MQGAEGAQAGFPAMERRSHMPHSIGKKEKKINENKGKFVSQKEYPMINHSGQEYEEDCLCVCVCIQLNHSAVQQKLAQHCKSAIIQSNKTCLIN